MSVGRLTVGALRSATAMSWASLAVRLLGFALLLPLLLRTLAAEEVGVWFLFQAVVGLVGLVDFGCAPTFARGVAYATTRGAEAGGSMHAVIRTMRFVYRRIGVAAFLLVVVAGSFAVAAPIGNLPDAETGWWAWAAIAAGAPVGVLGNMYSAYLQGTDQIALFRRWETFLAALGAGASCVVLLLGGGLLALACVSQAAVLAGVYVYRVLALRSAGPGAWTGSAEPDARTIRSTWPAAWRSGIGVLLTVGAIQGSSVVYAQFAKPAEIASYLLAQRLMQVLSDFANVPFYTRLPTLARQYAQGRLQELLAGAARGMLAANWLLVAGVLGTGAAAGYALESLGSETKFVAPVVWWLLATAILCERIGAMHLQLYSTTNRVVWHIANGVSGVLMLLVMPPAYHLLGLPGLPLGILIGYAGFYAPFSIACSYRAFGSGSLQMGLAATVAPLALLVAVLSGSLLH